MKNLRLRVISPDGVEATIATHGGQDGAGDYFAVVSIDGVMADQKVYGIDPVQSFVLGLRLIEDLTADRRIGPADGTGATPGASWRIEQD